VPAGTIANQQCVGACRDLAADLLEMLVHRFGIDARHDNGGADATSRTDGTEDVNGVVPVVAHHWRARADRRPHRFDGALLPNPGFVREPYLNCLALS